MPQLDFGPYIAEFYWLLVVFFLSFFIFSKFILPQLFAILKVKSKRLRKMNFVIKNNKEKSKIRLKRLFKRTMFFYRDVMFDYKDFFNNVKAIFIFKNLKTFNYNYNVYFLNFFFKKLNLKLYNLVISLND